MNLLATVLQRDEIRADCRYLISCNAVVRLQDFPVIGTGPIEESEAPLLIAHRADETKCGGTCAPVRFPAVVRAIITASGAIRVEDITLRNDAEGLVIDAGGGGIGLFGTNHCSK